MVTVNIGLVAAVIGLLATLGGVLWWVHNIIGRFELLERKSQHRKEDAEISLEGIQDCLDGLQQLGANHNVTEMDKKLQCYLRKSR